MSGPKVVRVVTRDELIATCEAHLRRLTEAEIRWRTRSQIIGELNSSDVQATEVRHASLRRLLDTDDFVSLQDQVPAEILFLNNDLREREELAVRKATMRRRSQQNNRSIAKGLIGTLKAQSTCAPPALLLALQSIADGTASGGIDATLADGFAQLSTSPTQESLDDAQRDIARALQTEKSATWIVEPATSRNPRLDHADSHISRMQILYGTASADAFLLRLRLIDQELNDERRNMLLDSLIVDVARSIAEHETIHTNLSTLRSLVEEMVATFQDAETSLYRSAQASLEDASADPQHVSKLIANISRLLEVENQQRAARFRRQAVLDGLSSLGYEVREGMETAWSQDGRVVLRKSSTPGIGVEIGGNAQGGRLQVRAVSLSGQHDHSRDRDIETLWCSDFSRLQSLLAENGNELSIERALAIGEARLKVVQLAPNQYNIGSVNLAKGSS